MTTNEHARSGANAGTATGRNDAARTEPDWTDQVTDLVVGAVDSVRDKTTGPILMVARGLVYGVVALLVGLLALGLLTVAIVRALSLLPGPQWTTYAVAGAVLCLGGLLAWSKRGPVDG